MAEVRYDAKSHRMAKQWLLAHDYYTFANLERGAVIQILAEYIYVTKSGESFSGRTLVSKTKGGGSIPPSPAIDEKCPCIGTGADGTKNHNESSGVVAECVIIPAGKWIPCKNHLHCYRALTGVYKFEEPAETTHTCNGTLKTFAKAACPYCDLDSMVEARAREMVRDVLRRFDAN